MQHSQSANENGHGSIESAETGSTEDIEDTETACQGEPLSPNDEIDELQLTAAERGELLHLRKENTDLNHEIEKLRFE